MKLSSWRRQIDVVLLCSRYLTGTRGTERLSSFNDLFVIEQLSCSTGAAAAAAVAAAVSSIRSSRRVKAGAVAMAPLCLLRSLSHLVPLAVCK